jgi:hypothetical protein
VLVITYCIWHFAAVSTQLADHAGLLALRTILLIVKPARHSPLHSIEHCGVNRSLIHSGEAADEVCPFDGLHILIRAQGCLNLLTG